MVLVVTGIVLVGEHDHARRDEPRDVVDMPMCVVTGASLAEPDRLSNTEIFVENALIPLARQARIALLHR